MPNQAEPTTTVHLAAGDAELTVLPDQGCRIGSLRIAGTELLRTESPRQHGYGSFPMVPWVGRTALGRFRNGPVTHQLPVNSPPHAIHGTGVRETWHRVNSASTPTSAAFYYDLADPWPYPGRVTQVFDLASDHVLITLAVETASESFPAQAGWHPWFRRSLNDGGAEVELAFSPAWMEVRGPDHLPSGRRIDTPSFPSNGDGPAGPWDDCFGMPDGVDVTLTWAGEMRLRVTSSAAWVVIYDEQPDAVCVEPQSGPPNGLNTAPRLVTPINPLEVTTRWAWSVPDAS